MARGHARLLRIVSLSLFLTSIANGRTHTISRGVYTQPAAHKSATPPNYAPATTKLYDLLHTRLDLRVDWKNQQLHGKATLQLKPHCYPQTILRLDAHQLIIHHVKKIHEETIDLPYKQSEQDLLIYLDQTYTKDDLLTIEITYSTAPSKSKKKGPITFNSPQGVYFIPTNERNNSQQLWTQGEPNSSSYWFPTLDSPNQRCTQETYITVDNLFKTLSNGTLVYNTLNEDQTRTDYWRLEVPHAPYLFMLAVGEFSEITDEWNDIPINYYVEEPYAPYASMIFKHTPQMLSFFSEQLDYPFPWPSYKQIIVKDYIAGAMENTTAVLFSQAIQGDERTLLDNLDRDVVIAHELFHHWFGNLVTCEAWGQLFLNEALATWGSHAWYDYKYGRDERDRLIATSMKQYLTEAKEKKVPVIRDRYNRSFDMFDNHTYHKGALILHMLETYIGKEAFSQAIRTYLKNYAFSSTDVHQLRKAFEEVTGEDLNWFFNQWLFLPGHPLLRIEQSYKNGLLCLKIAQKQPAPAPIYRLPLSIEVWLENKKETYPITLEKGYQEFNFTVGSQPKAIYIDRNYVLAGEIEHIQSPQAWRHLYQEGKDFLARYQAIQAIQHNKKDGASYQFFMDVLHDPHWFFQVIAIDIFKHYQPLDATYPTLQAVETSLTSLLQSDASWVRKKAIKTLSSLSTAPKHQALYKKYTQDSSYQVASTAIYAYATHLPTTSATQEKAFLLPFEQSKAAPILVQLAKHYVTSRQPNKYTWLEKKTKKICTQPGGEKLIIYLSAYAATLGTAAQQAATLSIIETILQQHPLTPPLYRSIQKALEQFPEKKATAKLFMLLQS